MPELPEVETIRRGLVERYTGAHVRSLEVLDRRLGTHAQARAWHDRMAGRRLTAFERKGKYLGLVLSNEMRFVIHLRMTGQILTGSVGKPRLRLRFQEHPDLSLADTRRFAEVWLQPAQAEWPSAVPLGPDALTEATPQAFALGLRGKRTAIHAALLDQRLLAGVGNIYSQEALFQAGLRPARRAGSLKLAQRGRLFSELQRALQRGIEHRGTTRRDYRDLDGNPGSAQTWHAVYDRAGRPCLNCQSTLKAVTVAGRTAVFCPRCQR